MWQSQEDLRLSSYIPEKSTGFVPTFRTKVPETDSVPADGRFGFALDELMGQKEKGGSKLRKMLHTCEMETECRTMRRMERKDPVYRIPVNIWQPESG
jgi:hypothetical protein